MHLWYIKHEFFLLTSFFVRGAPQWGPLSCHCLLHHFDYFFKNFYSGHAVLASHEYDKAKNIHFMPIAEIHTLCAVYANLKGPRRDWLLP